MLKNYLFSPFCSAPFLCSSPLFLFLSAPHTSFFLFCFLVSRHFSSSLFFQPSFSFLQVCCPLFFSPKYLFFSPNVFQFFNPNIFQPKNTFFSPKRFCFSPKLFSVQPKTFFFGFSSAILLFFFFLLYSFLVQPSFFSLSAPSFFSFLQLHLSNTQYSL